MKYEPDPVSFRLDESHSQQLQKQAEKWGVSASDYARQMVIDALEDTTRQNVVDGLYDHTRHLEKLQREITASRMDIATIYKAMMEQLEQLGEQRVDLASAVSVLLVAAGKLSKEASEAWVKENLLPDKHLTFSEK